MAKKPAPAAQSGPSDEAVGKFDKFGAFALAIPTFLLACVAIAVGFSYTHANYDVSLGGMMAKTIPDWEGGPESVGVKRALTPKIKGFEATGYLARPNAGEMDVAVLNVGYEDNVNLGDVFTLKKDLGEGVRFEIVVFDVQANTSRGYILLGQTERKYDLKLSSLKELCGGESDIEVQRQWKDQIVRRYVEERSTGQ